MAKDFESQGFDDFNPSDLHGEFHGEISPDLHSTSPQLHCHKGEGKATLTAPCTRADLAKHLDLAPSSITKILKAIEQTRGTNGLYAAGNKLTEAALREVEAYRELGAEDYRALYASEPRSIENGGLTVYDRPYVPAFDPGSFDDVEPEQLLSMLATAQTRKQADLAKTRAETQRGNLDSLRDTWDDIELQNRYAEGFKKEAQLDQAEEAGRLAYWKQKLAAELGKSGDSYGNGGSK